MDLNVAYSYSKLALKASEQVLVVNERLNCPLPYYYYSYYYSLYVLLYIILHSRGNSKLNYVLDNSETNYYKFSDYYSFIYEISWLPVTTL